MLSLIAVSLALSGQLAEYRISGQARAGFMRERGGISASETTELTTMEHRCRASTTDDKVYTHCVKDYVSKAQMVGRFKNIQIMFVD